MLAAVWIDRERAARRSAAGSSSITLAAEYRNIRGVYAALCGHL